MYRFQFTFRDRVSAARILGEALKDRIDRKNRKSSVVLGIPRGGVITADIIASKLSTELFDILVSRKLTSPRNREQAIGAIMEDNTTYIIPRLVSEMQISSNYLEKEKVEQLNEIKRRTALYRGQPRSNFSSFIKDRIVIIADDGASSGATIIASCQWLSKLVYKPRLLIVAIPVAPKSTVKLLEKECKAKVEVVNSPPDNQFNSVEQYHQDFQTVPDEQIISIMVKRNLLKYHSY
jgi:putative phosphoribosyl transferase